MEYKIKDGKLILQNERTVIDWCCGEYPDSFEKVSEKFGELRRWMVTVTVILKHKQTQKLYGLRYERGLTEIQNDGAYVTEFDEYEEREKIVKFYVKKG